MPVRDAIHSSEVSMSSSRSELDTTCDIGHSFVHRIKIIMNRTSWGKSCLPTRAIGIDLLIITARPAFLPIFAKSIDRGRVGIILHTPTSSHVNSPPHPPHLPTTQTSRLPYSAVDTPVQNQRQVGWSACVQPRQSGCSRTKPPRQKPEHRKQKLPSLTFNGAIKLPGGVEPVPRETTVKRRKKQTKNRTQNKRKTKRCKAMQSAPFWHFKKASMNCCYRTSDVWNLDCYEFTRSDNMFRLLTGRRVTHVRAGPATIEYRQHTVLFILL